MLAPRYRSLRALLWLSVMAASAVQAQSDAGASADAQREQLIAQLRALHWVRGPADVSIGGNSTLSLPDGYVFLPPADTKKFLELQRNLSDGKAALLAPNSLHWSALLEFGDEGYVKDSDKIDAPALLEALKRNTEIGNRERQLRGWPTLQVKDWEKVPAYNPASRRLEWAVDVGTSSGEVVNFFTKILGRRGVTSVVMATAPGDVGNAEADLNSVLAGYRFNAGDTYAEWRAGDKVAAYGLTALILGGAAAVAAKKGLFTVIAGALAAGWKFVVAGALAASAWLRSLFKKKTNAA